MVVQAPKRLGAKFSDFSRGAGAYEHADGYYAVATNADTRWGTIIPGPLESADVLGIAAGFRIIRMVMHNNTEVLATTNGTDTKIYRLETTWVEKATLLAVVCTDAVSFANVYAVALGPSVAFQYTTATGGGAWTFSNSGKSGNAARANYFLLQTNGLANPRVIAVVNPNLLYFYASLSDTTSTTSSTVGDSVTATDFFTSLAEDDNGVVLIGKRHALFSIDSAGVVVKLSPDYPDPLLDAGGQSDRNNFESWCQIEGRTYYVVGGYEIVEYFHAQLNEFIGPKWSGPQIPRMHLPINCIAKAGNWLIAALGSKNSATLMNVTNAPGGTAMLGNTFTVTSELWAGRYEPGANGLEFVWHGVLLLCSNPLRYMWYAEKTGYLYMASGDSQLVNAQQRRCYFLTMPPQFHQADATNVILNNGTWTVETGRVTLGDSFAPARLREVRAHSLGLASTTPSLAVRYRAAQDFETTAYTTLVTWTDNYHPTNGCRFPPYTTAKVAQFQFVGVGTGTSYPLMLDAELVAEEYQRMGLARAG